MVLIERYWTLVNIATVAGQWVKIGETPSSNDVELGVICGVAGTPLTKSPACTLTISKRP